MSDELYRLHTMLCDAGKDADYVADSFGDNDQIKLWHDEEHDSYTLISDALDEDGYPFHGFMWSDYEVLGENFRDESAGSEGYEEDAGKAAAYLLARLA
jgi:hypothetical protein